MFLRFCNPRFQFFLLRFLFRCRGEDVNERLHDTLVAGSRHRNPIKTRLPRGFGNTRMRRHDRHVLERQGFIDGEMFAGKFFEIAHAFRARQQPSVGLAGEQCVDAFPVAHGRFRHDPPIRCHLLHLRARCAQRVRKPLAAAVATHDQDAFVFETIRAEMRFDSRIERFGIVTGIRRCFGHRCTSRRADGRIGRRRYALSRECSHAAGSDHADRNMRRPRGAERGESVIDCIRRYEHHQRIPKFSGRVQPAERGAQRRGIGHRADIDEWKLDRLETGTRKQGEQRGRLARRSGDDNGRSLRWPFSR